MYVVYLIFKIKFIIIQMGSILNKYPSFFLVSKNTTHKMYEALRAFHVDNLSSKEVAKKYNYSVAYFDKLRSRFHKQIQSGEEPLFFVEKKPGAPVNPENDDIIELVIQLRKQGLSVPDIQVVLSSKGRYMSTRWIDLVLKKNNYSRLPKRSKQEALSIRVPQKILPEKTIQIDINDYVNCVYRTIDGGIFYFLPLLAKLEIDKLVEKAGYPGTKKISNLNYFLSILSLKLMDKERLSHSHSLSFDAGLGLFAGLNVLPKDASISSYSYNVTRKTNISFLKLLAEKVNNEVELSGDINLDFTTIPYWGDKRVLEKNWSGTRRHALKSVLSLIAQDADTGLLIYGNANVRKKSSKCEVLEFVDFWKKGNLKEIKCLIFDSKFTVLENLRKLDKEDIKFITIRQRNPKLVEEFTSPNKKKWKEVELDILKRKHKKVAVNDTKVIIEKYDKTKRIRQIVMKNHGKEKPAFILTNDFKATTKQIITKYARRWLVEKSISEQIDFFHLNLLSSSVVIKVDFDLTMTILANTLYRLLAKELPRYENETAKSIYINFIHNGADIKIYQGEILVEVLKKSHNPIIMGSSVFEEHNRIPWLGNYLLKIKTQNTA